MDLKRRRGDLLVSFMGGMKHAFVLIVMAIVTVVPGSAERLTVLFTSDLHARVGRLAAVGEAIETVRAEAENVLLVDAGDTWHDFRIPPLASWGGEETVQWMNSVGYDAMTIGNHEFAVGNRWFEELATESLFPILSANTLVLGGMQRLFGSSIRWTSGSWNVRIVGLTTREFFPAGMIPWMRIEDPGPALDRVVTSEERTDPNLLIVVVAHFGVAEASELAHGAPWIDVIVTGHTHEPTETPSVIGDTLIVQGAPFALGLGRLDLAIDEEGHVTDWWLEQICVDGPALGDPGREGPRRLAAVVLLSAAAAFVWSCGL